MMCYYSAATSSTFLQTLPSCFWQPVSKLLVFKGPTVWAFLTVCLGTELYYLHFVNSRLHTILIGEASADVNISLEGYYSTTLTLWPKCFMSTLFSCTCHYFIECIWWKSTVLCKQAHYIRWQYYPCKHAPLACLLQVEATALIHESGCVWDRCFVTLPAVSPFVL